MSVRVHTDVVVSVGWIGGGGEMRCRFGSSDRGGTSNETRLGRGGLSEGGGGLAGNVWLLSRAGDVAAAGAVVSISIGSIISLMVMLAWR